MDINKYNEIRYDLSFDDSSKVYALLDISRGIYKFNIDLLSINQGNFKIETKYIYNGDFNKPVYTINNIGHNGWKLNIEQFVCKYTINMNLDDFTTNDYVYIDSMWRIHRFIKYKTNDSIDYYYCSDTSGLVLKESTQNITIENETEALTFNTNGRLVEYHLKINNNISKIITYQNNKIASIYDARLTSNAILFSYDNNKLVEVSTTSTSETFLLDYDNNNLTKIYYNYPINDNDYLLIEYNNSRMIKIIDCEKLVGFSLTYSNQKLATLFIGAVTKGYNTISINNTYPQNNNYVKGNDYYIKNRNVSNNTISYSMYTVNIKYKNWYTYDDNATTITDEDIINTIYYFDNQKHLLSVLEKRNQSYYVDTYNPSIELINSEGTSNIKINNRKSHEVQSNSTYVLSSQDVDAYLSQIPSIGNGNYMYQNKVLSFWFMPLNDIYDEVRIKVEVQKVNSTVYTYSNIITPMKSGCWVKIEIPFYLKNKVNNVEDASHIESIKIKLQNVYTNWLFNDMKVLDVDASELFIGNERLNGDSQFTYSIGNDEYMQQITRDFYLSASDIISTYKEMYISKLANKQTFDIVLCDGKRRIEASSLCLINGVTNTVFNINSSNIANLSISSTQTSRTNDSLEKKITLEFESINNGSYNIKYHLNYRHNKSNTINTYATTIIKNQYNMDISETDIYGVKKTYTFDAYGNIEQIDLSDVNNNLTISEMYGYDNISAINRQLPLTITKNGLTTRYSYSTNYQYLDYVLVGSLRKQYYYDYLGRVSRIVFINNNNDQIIKENDITYNQEGLVQNLYDNINNYHFNYDSANCIKNIIINNDLIESYQYIRGEDSYTTINKIYQNSNELTNTAYYNKYQHLKEASISQQYIDYDYEYEDNKIRTSRIKHIFDPFNGHDIYYSYFDEHNAIEDCDGYSEYDNDLRIISKNIFHNKSISYRIKPDKYYVKNYNMSNGLELYDDLNLRVDCEKYSDDTYLFNYNNNDDLETKYNYTYDGVGRITSINGENVDYNGKKVQINKTITYNTTNSLLSSINYSINTTINNNQSSKNILYNIAYDVLNYISSFSKTIDNNTYNYQYGYDICGEVTSELNNSDTYNYCYDNNKISLIKKNNINIKEFEYQNNRLNCYKDLINNVNNYITYDNYGNMTSIGNNTITYNSQNKMASYQYGNNTYHYYYNYQGIRYKKEIITNVGLNNEESEVVEYILDGDTILCEKHIIQNTTNYLYFYYNLSGIDSIEYNGKKYKLLRDCLNNITEILLEDKIICSYNYDAWGNSTSTVYYNNIDNNIFNDALYVISHNPFRYKGYYYDIETGLYYCNYRYYSPLLCQWTTPDSIDYLDIESIYGLNLYCYCNNDPINYYDLSGHIAISTIIFLACIGIGIVAGGVYAGVTAYNEGARGWELVGWTSLGALVGGAIGGLVGYYAGPMAAGLFTSGGGFAFAGGIASGGAVSASLGATVVAVGALNVTAIGALFASSVLMFAKKTKLSGKDTSSDKPSWVTKDMVDPNKTPQHNAKNILDQKYGHGNWSKGPKTEYNKIVKWIERFVRYYRGY